MLNLVVTQNIDCLDIKTNISRQKIVFAHGNVLDAHCSNSKCENKIDIDLMNKHVKDNKVLYCGKCSAPCKHKIVFYGESLPREFFDNIEVRFNRYKVFFMQKKIKII